eukprot:5857838-Amphidinium_carterae.1
MPSTWGRFPWTQPQSQFSDDQLMTRTVPSGEPPPIGEVHLSRLQAMPSALHCHCPAASDRMTYTWNVGSDIS